MVRGGVLLPEAAGAGGLGHCLCGDVQLRAGDAGGCAGAGGDGGSPQPLRCSLSPGLCSQSKDAGERGGCREPVLPRHQPFLQPGLLVCGARLGARRELVAAVCPDPWVPGLPAASAPPGTRHGWGWIDSASLSLTEHQLLWNRRKQGFLIKKKKKRQVMISAFPVQLLWKQHSCSRI